MNILRNFLNKIKNLPHWVKLIVYKELSECFDGLENSDVCVFLTFVPILTFNGVNELEQKKCGLDGNTYNFLRYVKSGYTIYEISLNTFLSLEETAKCLIFCQEQGFINKPDEKIQMLIEYIAGKSEFDGADNTLLKLKSESQNRTVLDSVVVPKISDTNINQDEITKLRNENRRLREKLGRLHEVVQGVIR